MQRISSRFVALFEISFRVLKICDICDKRVLRPAIPVIEPIFCHRSCHKPRHICHKSVTTCHKLSQVFRPVTDFSVTDVTGHGELGNEPSLWTQPAMQTRPPEQPPGAGMAYLPRAAPQARSMPCVSATGPPSRAAPTRSCRARPLSQRGSPCEDSTLRPSQWGRSPCRAQAGSSGSW